MTTRKRTIWGKVAEMAQKDGLEHRQERGSSLRAQETKSALLDTAQKSANEGLATSS